MSGRPPRGRQKPRREASPPPPLKVVVRRLPPNLPEHIFHTSIAKWHKLIDWSEYVPGKLATSRLENDKFSRAYLKFRKSIDCAGFVKQYHGHAFISSEDREYRACAEIAPFQKVSKPLSGAAKSKDALCGTIEQDPDYMAFMESLKTVVPHKKEEEIVASKITPLIEHLRLQKAKNEEKAKARRAKESAAKSRQQEEKRKVVQAQADANTAKLREKAAAAAPPTKSAQPKNKSVKETVRKEDPSSTTSTKKGQKAPRNKNQDRSIKGAAAADTGVLPKKPAVPSVVTNPSPLAQQRAPKNKSTDGAKLTNGDGKGNRSKKAKKGKVVNGTDSKTPSTKIHATVDISGPTPAEMAALAKKG